MKDTSFEKLDKKLTTKLNSTSTAKGWSDLLTIMRDILSLLTKYKNVDFNKITDKNVLAKRLSQGLNPECPSGLHEVTLEVYQLILSNISQNYNHKLMDNLYLFAYGLFPFFPNAANNNKKYFLEKIVEPIFLPLNKEELKLCLPGLLSSLIPGLDDNNDQTTKLIYKVFDQFISNNNGEMERDFFGIYWMLLLRCQHLRPSGIKYLLEKITKYQDLVKLDEDKQKEIIDKQFPNINTTVVNALCEIIKDKDIPTVRNGMDFIISRIPLTQKNNMIDDNAKINLIISGLHLLIKNEDSTVRRLKNWLLGLNGPDDEVNFNSEDMKYKMNLVIEAFKIIFNSEKNLVEEELLSNIKIIHKLLESEEEFINLILPKVSYIILKSVVNYWEIELDASESVENNNIIDQIKLLFYINDICFDYFWKSIAESIKELSQENIDEKNLQKRIIEVLSPLRFCLIFIDMQSNSKRIQYYIPIITNLIDVMKKMPLKRDNFKYVRTVIVISLAFVKSLQEAKFHDPNEEKVAKIINQKEKENHKNEVNFQIVDKVPEKNGRASFNLKVRNSVISLINEEENLNDEDDSNNDVYNICEMSTINYIMKDDKYNNIINDLTNNISKFHEYYINILNEFLNITNQITKFEIAFFRQCSELIIRLQEYSQEKEDTIPKWVNYFEKIIFNSNSENMMLSIEATNILIDLYFSSSLKNKVFLKIKNNFISEEIDEDTIKELKIEDIVNNIKVQNICLDLLIAKFYLLSNKQSNLSMIIELLVKLCHCDKNKFIKIINNTFNTEGDALKENVKLFSNFWKLANEYYPEENFFKNGECIFDMIDLLDNKTPIFRTLSKSWLNQSNQCYKKIIDPILLVLLDKNITYSRDENKSNFTKEFDTSKILDAFIKLKNIILNCNIMKFLKKNKSMEEIISMINFKCFPENDMYYIQTIISITLHYIKTKPLDNLNENFKKQIVSVNAASCELLEFFLSKITDKTFLINNSEIISEPILELLKIYLDEKDEVMPVQLLDVLKILLYSVNNVEFYKINKERYCNFLKNNRQLVSVLISGMTSDAFYIREHFISFTKTCVEKFISIISVDDKEELHNFYDLCNKFIQPLSEFLKTRIKLDEIGRDDTENYSHYDKKCNQLIFKNYCEEYKEYKKFDEGDIISILKGINDIISYCLKNDILDQANKSGSKKLVKIIFIPIPFIKKRALWLNAGFSGDWGAYKKELANSLKTSNPFTTFLTSIIDINDEKNSSEVTSMSNRLYHNQIFSLLNSFLSIWVNQSDKYEAYDYCLNSNGILPPNIDSKKNLSNDQINHAKEMIKNNPIKQYIISIAMNLFLTDSINFIKNVLDLWCVDSLNDKQYKLSIIELLISMDIPLDVVLFCVGTQLQSKIANNKDKYKKNSTEKCFEAQLTSSIEEAKYFHFIYSYLLINPDIYTKEKKENEIIEIWREINNILNFAMNNTKILYSFCWMYEIIHLASNKYRLFNIDNREVKNGIESIFSFITNKLVEAIFSDKFDSKYVKPNSLVLPFLPHIYYNIVKILYKNDNLYQKNLEGNSRNKKNKSSLESGNDRSNKTNFNMLLSNTMPDSEANDNRMSLKKRTKTNIGTNQTFQADILSKYNNAMSNIIYSFYMKYIKNAKLSSPYNQEKNPKSMDPKLLNENYKHLAFITLKENFYSIIKNLFDDNLNICKKYYIEIVNRSLNYLKKAEPSDFKAEIASDFLVDLMEKTPKNISICSKSALMEYVNSNYLFKVTPRELHKWRIIISQLREHYPDILVDLIKDMQDKNIFVKKTEEDKKRILRRVSFIIYSCEKDKFDKNFGLIKSKAKELLSEYTNNNSLEDEIFLIMRMLFLRFSHDGVMQMIRDLWPIIFTELIQNIKNGAKRKKNSLLLESLKFVELLSLVNIEEFSLYQWIFMIDTFDMNDLDLTKDNSLIRKITTNSELFKPLIIELVGNFDDQNIDKLYKSKQKGKSELCILSSNELIRQSLSFLYSIGDMNSYKVDANYEQIENSIETDYIVKGNDLL